MTLPSLEDRRAVAVHADELEEEGDPRAELVRAQLAGQDGAALISQHWSRWVGALAPEKTLLRWQFGHLVEAAFTAAPLDWRLTELIDRPAARFLRRLAIGGFGKVSPKGIEKLASLRELVWLTPSPAGHAPLSGGLETLSIDLQGEVTTNDLASLSASRLPRLTTLNTRCLPGSEDALCNAFAAASWWSSLTRWTHRVRTLQGLQALGRCGPLLARGGGGLVAFCEAPLLEQVPAGLRRALPHAEFTLLPVPVQPRDPEDFHKDAEISVTPVTAPTNFRSLPPRTHTPRASVQNSGTTDSKYVGSGVPFSELGAWSDLFSHCGWCSSLDTRCIYEDRSSLYSHFETTNYASWEYECLRCGLFTHSRKSRTS